VIEPPGDPLLTADYEALLARWIDRGTAREQQLRRVDSITGARLMGRKGAGDYSGILIPYIWPSEDHIREYRLRRDNPEYEAGKPKAKYLSPPGCRNMLFVPVGVTADLLGDITLPIILAEGEFKSMACLRAARRDNGPAARPHFLPMALSGVWNFRGSIGRTTNQNGVPVAEKGIIPDFDRVPFENRVVTIIFDRDLESKAAVRVARSALTRELHRRGAEVRWFTWPANIAPEAKGIDDLLAAAGPDAVLSLISGATPAPGERGWRANLILNKEELPKAILANVLTALREAPEFQGVLAYDEFSLSVVTKLQAPWQQVPGIWTDYDDSRCSEWLQRNAILVPTKLTAEGVKAVATQNRFHPVREYLQSLKWDGIDRIGTWLSSYLGVPRSAFADAVGERWLISACARIFKPGCQADYTLLLEGAQGARKSTALRVLAGEWFTDHISDLGSKDSRIELHGVWIVELGELDRLRGALNTKIKNFLTARSDHFRPPYARHAEHVARSNVFAATTNDPTPFTDETGNRRFWPVRCGEINIEKLKEDRDQLWAEASSRFFNGVPWHFDKPDLDRQAEREQAERYEEGVWDDTIRNWIANPGVRRDFNGRPIEPFDSTQERVTVTDILIHAIGKRIDQCTQADKIQVAKCLKHLGWHRSQRRIGDSRPRFYLPPVEIK
jgi:predicted P-loop ATPase